MKYNLMAFKRYANKRGWDDVSREMFNRRIEKRAHKGKPRVIESLINNPRFYDEDSESFYEYWLEDGMEDWTDEEIKQYADDMIERIYSPWDCTGKRFTIYIHYHRNPSGLVSFVHYFGIDI